MAENKKPLRVFLDASVLVAAALSPSGGSFRVIAESPTRGFLVFTSPYAHREAETTLINQYLRALPALYHLMTFVEISPDAPLDVVETLLEIIDFKDAPVLGAALGIGADALLTLDRAHFLKNSKITNAYARLRVMTPGDFLTKYF